MSRYFEARWRGYRKMSIRRSPGTALSSGRGALVWRGALCRGALPDAARSVGRGALCRARRALPGAARSAGRGALSRVLALQRVDTLVGRATLSRTGAAPSRAGPPWGCGQARTGLPRFLLFVPGRAYK